ncbi:MAG: hypothetical protein PHT63_07290, partial [Bacteroidales bacterium]|nr:hypothetical protein [Bacteroidales bacterium]
MKKVNERLSNRKYLFNNKQMIRKIIFFFTSSRFVLFVFLTFSLLSCSAEREKQNSFYKKFQHWDSLTVKSPAMILDSLGSVNNKDLNKENLMYKSLLTCIASYWSETSMNDSTVMSKVVNWYRKNADYRNLSRALLYSSRVRYNNKLLPAKTICARLKEAESIYYNNKLNDLLTEAVLNKYLALIQPVLKSLRITTDSVQANIKKYSNKSIMLFYSLGYYHLVDFELTHPLLFSPQHYVVMNTFSSSRNFITEENTFNEKAESEFINLISTYDTIHPDILREAYSNLINILFSENKLEKAIHYSKEYYSKKLSRDIRYSSTTAKFLSYLANSYLKQGKLDSAFKYINLCKDYSQSSIDSATYAYPLLLEYYLQKKDYKNVYTTVEILHKLNFDNAKSVNIKARLKLSKHISALNETLGNMI